MSLPAYQYNIVVVGAVESGGRGKSKAATLAEQSLEANKNKEMKEKHNGRAEIPERN